MSQPEPPLNFRPPRIYVLKQVWEQPPAARRAERVAAACPGAEVATFTYDEFPDIVVAEGWDHFPKMGTLKEVPPPIPVLGLYRFDREAVARDAERMEQPFTHPSLRPYLESNLEWKCISSL